MPRRFASGNSAIGIAKLEHLTQKHILDLYTCTECGRCSDNCPAYITDKKLSPKHLTLALRNHVYQTEQARFGGTVPSDEGAKPDASAEGDGWNAFLGAVWRNVDAGTGADFDDFGWSIQGDTALTPIGLLLLLGGFVGALLAVPLTAAVKVLFVRYIWVRGSLV